MSRAAGINKPVFTKQAISKYFKTRFTELIPIYNAENPIDYAHLINPFKPLKLLTLRQWNLFFAGFWCWTWDAFDYFSVSLNVSNLAESFNVSVKDITWGITLVLMLRSIGAFGFGIMSDRYGRRLPIIIVLICLTALQIGLGFVQTFKQFLAVRALFGIFMGGLFGPACALSLEDAPPQAHGILSGIFEQGYPFGYLLVVCFQRAITYNSSHTWRALFWFSAGPSVIFIIWVALVGETEAFVKHKEAIKVASNGSSTNKTKLFIDQAKNALKQYWLVCIYLIFLMAGFNFASHGSQDLYPTMLTKQLGYGADRSTVTNSVANLGAIAGGIVIGHLSSFFGRRFMIIIACIIGGALIYPWAFVRNSGINASVFFLQFMVSGAWGVVPIYLSEVSPPNFRTFVSGLAYQLGNLASSASSTIETTIGERFPIMDPATGLPIKGVYNYSKVMAIFVGCVFGYLIVITLIGPENSNVTLQIVDSDDDLKHSTSSSSDGEYSEKV